MIVVVYWTGVWVSSRGTKGVAGLASGGLIIGTLIPGAVLVNLATAGHSAIDLRERAVLDIVKAMYDGSIDGLPARAATLDSTPGGLGIRLLVWGVAAAGALEQALPAAVPRAVQRVTTS